MIVKQFIKYALGIAGVFIMYLTAKKIYNLGICKNLDIVGNYSYDIYLMHNPYIVATSSILLNSVLHISSVVTIIIAVLLGIIIPIIVSRLIINKSKILSLIMLGK